MSARAAIEAWLLLLLLSTATTASTLVTVPQAYRSAFAAVVLLLALLKARIILARYLRLSQAAAIQRGFDLVLAVFVALAWGLFAFGARGGA